MSSTVFNPTRRRVVSVMLEIVEDEGASQTCRIQAAQVLSDIGATDMMPGASPNDLAGARFGTDHGPDYYDLRQRIKDVEDKLRDFARIVADKLDIEEQK